MSSVEIKVDSSQYIEQVANETLTAFGNIAQRAEQSLKDGQALGSMAFGSINTFTSEAAIRNQEQINKANRESYLHLKKEPAIARVVIEDEIGSRRTHYFCRCEQGMPNQGVVSYRAPIGRLASLDVGDAYSLPDGSEVYVVEQAQLRPNLTADGWDARDTIIEGEDFGPVTIESLRKLLTDVVGEAAAEDILEQILTADSARANIYEGVRRNVITKMGLRDQPILDKYQDEIFRLPLNKRLLILGPPGTGKTTTLIRRLGQKLDSVYLEEGDKQLVESLAQAEGSVHANSWLMFTPTELLKQYLKEAFNREGIPAPDQKIKTWQDCRRELARNTLGVLRTSTGGGTFVLKDELQSLGDDALARPLPWFEAFDAYHRKAYAQELQDATTQLVETEIAEARGLGERLNAALAQNPGNMAALFTSLAREIPSVQALLSRLKDESDKKLKAALNLQLNRDRNFLNELVRFMGSLHQTQATDVDDQDELDVDDDDETPLATTPTAKAIAAFNSAVRAQARAAAGKRPPSKASRSGRIIEWLGERSLPESDRAIVGASLVIQTAARRFQSPVRRYIGDLPKRYRSFRREHQQDGTWYQDAGFEARDIHPLELDVVLLGILRSAGELLSKLDVQRDIDTPAWSPLKAVMGLYRHQVLVDEATDFSPIQLACMAALAHPRLRSFFACGDFNQRLTTWGSRSVDEMKWVFGDFEIRHVTVAYRQSRQLNELARAMIHAVGAAEQDASLPDKVDNDGVAPALLERTEGEDIARWLADRIREIDRFYGQLPSIAIFVNSEDAVGPMADALSANLAEDNIRAVACREGQAVGQENDIRVFDVQHIKGLEFEAVFFVGVDQLAQLHPNLFDKYLYVGATRAATYLGMTCKETLPATIQVLRPHFGTDWNPSR